MIKKIKYYKAKILLRLIQKELQLVLNKIDEKSTDKFIDLILNSKNIFLTGQGRSGFVAESFAMRLTHLGLNPHVIGEATSPNIKNKDLLIAISGSGKTRLTLDIVKEAKKSKAKICSISSSKNNSLAKKSNLVIEIKGKTKLGKRKSIEPLGSLFEQATFLYLDSIIIILMKKLGKKEKDLRKKHIKLE